MPQTLLGSSWKSIVLGMERYSGLICFAPQQLLSFTVKAIVEERRKNGGDSNKKGDFLDVLLPVTNLSEDEKVSFVLDALLGGYETTSLLMSMAVYFLGLSPSALQQLKLEHQSIRVHKKKNEGLSIEGYKKMEFTQFVINGALRCGNIVKFVHRKVLKDVTFKGRLVVANADWDVVLYTYRAEDGPTILVIEDTEGYIFGGFASQPWERQSEFYGDMKSFLFQLYPKASIFCPTGAVNFSSESIPNGIGFGGQARHFGLFLSANFDQGHTFSCTTFNSPCLSKTNRISPQVIECWGVKPKAVQMGRSTELAKGTVLERFEEDQNMLNLVGLANSSN